MRLSLDLGKTLSELLESMTPREFALWVQYYAEFPPEEPANYRAASIQAAVYNASGNLKLGSSAKPKDFMPKPKPKPMSAEQLAAFVKTGLGITDGS